MKRIFAVFLVLCLLVPAGSLFASAATTYTSGNYEYTLSSGKATITGLTSSLSGAVSIPSALNGYSVVAIADASSSADGVFYRCTSITSVTLPSTLTKIGDYSFAWCSGMTSVSIPSSVVQIGKNAFTYCRSLSSITLPNSVTTLGSGVFYNCSGLSSVTIGSGIKTIGVDTFNTCTALTSINIPTSVTSIGGYAFANCRSLKDVNIPSTVSSIDSTTFQNSSNVTIVCESGSYAEKYANEQGIKSNTSGETNKDTVASDGTAISLSKDEYVVGIGEEFPLSGELYSPKGTSGMTLQWSLTDNTGVLINTPASVANIDANHLIFSTLATGRKEGYYTVTVRTSNGASTSRTIHITSKHEIYIWEDNQEKAICTKESIDEFALKIPSIAYSPELANMMMGFADGAYDPNRLTRSLNSHGFSETFYADSLYEATKVGASFNIDGVKLAFSSKEEFQNYIVGLFVTDAAFTISRKVSPTGDNIVLITVRGSTTVADWIGNLEFMTKTGSHPNFQKCADLIYQCLEYYCGNIDKRNTKYLITGHSRGAAVANLLSVKLINAGVPQNNLYDYNFACPDVAVDKPESWTKSGKYSNIFNICCYNDPVPYLPGVAGDAFLVDLDSVLFGLDEVWGKYGITKWFASDWSNKSLKIDYHLQPHYLKTMSKLESFGSMRYKSDCPKQSIKNIRFKCPVDVEIHSSNNSPIIGVIDNRIEVYDSLLPIFAFVHGDKKSFAIFDDTDFFITMMGTDYGKMDITAQDIVLSTGNSIATKEFKNIALERGKTFKGVLSDNDLIANVEIYGTNKGSVETFVDVDGTEKPIACKIKSLELSDITMRYKTSSNIILRVEADDSAQYTVKYESSDPAVVSVDEGGKVYAVRRGVAEILVTVTDEYGNTAYDVCTVTVKYSLWQWLIIIFLLGFIWY